MSGILNEAVTPCPSRSSNNDTLDSLWRDGLGSFDETANLDFTTEIKAPALTKAKPRRRTRAVSSFQIHDDNNEEKPVPPINKRRKENGAVVEPSNGKSSLLAQPAQRFRPKVSFAPSPSSTNLQRHREIGPSSKIMEPDAVKNKNLLMRINGKEQKTEREMALKKGVRRDTVYIPTEDTTVASVFMGLFSPLKSQTMNEINGQIPNDTEIDSLEARIARKRHTKRSLTSSARRAPLQPSTKIAQEASIRVDVAGKNGGKENTPPGSLLVDNKDKCLEHELPVFEQPKTTRAGNMSTLKKNRTDEMVYSGSKARLSHGPQRRAVLGDKSNAKQVAVDSSQKRNSMAKPNSTRDVQFSRKSTLSTSASHGKSNMVPARVALSDIKAKQLDKEFPLLTENISNPELYEDNWLTHQEILITQLLNGLFEQTDADNHASFNDPATLRHELLDHCQNDSFTLLYKRIQASLLYGAMSIPKDVLARNSRLKQDLGMKRKILDFWTQNYDLRALRAALETVIGRRIASQDIDCSPYETTKPILKKRLEAFLDTFLLRNEDMGQRTTGAQGKDGDLAGRAYRRTILRSIMIIVILDKAKMCPGTTLPRLFVTSSTLKSSAAVLQALARLLLPSSGDIVKSLGHLDCQVSYKQHQLQEYDYRISNLAVDVRDGVRLTRIIELLLYSCIHPDPEHTTTTVTLPDEGGVFSFANEEQWPLSPQLKLPCTSRTVKLYNVQVALNALASTSGAGVYSHDVSAEDIVDGHREKTIALLWRLVSKWGLPGLVDWEDVRQEIGRLKRKTVSQFAYEQISSETELDEQVGDCTVLLKQWASLLAHLKGLRLDNLSTDFADGRIYESIVDEYQGYILGSVVGGSTSSSTLASRLQALGCSPQFGKSFHSE